MANPADKQPTEPGDDADPLNSTVEMPEINIVPHLSAPPETIIMPPLKRPTTPHLGDDDAAKK